MARNFGRLKKDLEELKLFEDCISTRDSEEDVKEFKKYIDECLEVINKLIKREAGKELTTESIEGIVDIKHHLDFMKAKNNKALISTDEMILRGLYNFFKLEGYNESHLSKVIYNETFEHKGIKY